VIKGAKKSFGQKRPFLSQQKNIGATMVKKILLKHKNKHGLFFLVSLTYYRGSQTLFSVQWFNPAGHFRALRFTSFSAARQFFLFATSTKIKVKQLKLNLN